MMVGTAGVRSERLILDSQVTSSSAEPGQVLVFLIMVSSPIGLAEFWESEPMWTCKNIDSIRDRGRRYHYLDDRPSK